MNILEIKNLHVSIEGKEILKGINLTLELGEVNALMGPNGSGKSTLANVIMGHPAYEITEGTILFNGEDITNINATERAKKGLFLSFQYPQEISGVTISNFLRTALNGRLEKPISVMDFHKLFKEKMKLLKVPEEFETRYLNEGFSGGEKKKSEILQLAVLNPKLSILDETDSGLDIDALKAVSNGINSIKNKDNCFLIITHYKRILEHIKPDKVFIMVDGRIVKEGDSTLVDRLEAEGYGWINED